MTSAPRGMVNSNVLSGSPTFSLKFENVNVERVPCLSAAVSERIWKRLAVDDELEPVVVALRSLGCSFSA